MRKRRLIRTKKREVPIDHPGPEPLRRNTMTNKTGKPGIKSTPSSAQFEGIPKSAKGIVATDTSSKDWKEKVLGAKKAKKAEEEAQKQLKQQQDKEKWDSVPAWKRKLMEQKEKEAEEKNKPKAMAVQQKKELQAKISAMAPWKRELFIKKHGLEGQFDF